MSATLSASIPQGERSMKITHVTTRVLRTPADNPLVVGLPGPHRHPRVRHPRAGHRPGPRGHRPDVLRRRPHAGAQGRGGRLWPVSWSATIRTQVEAIAAKLRRAAGSSGPGGIFSLALSAVDMACWDLKGKAVGQSVCALLGGLRDRVPTYASGALMRPHPVDYLAKAGPRLARHGLSPDEDAVRERAHAWPPRSSACVSCARPSGPTSISCATSTSSGA